MNQDGQDFELHFSDFDLDFCQSDSKVADTVEKHVLVILIMFLVNQYGYVKDSPPELYSLHATMVAEFKANRTFKNLLSSIQTTTIIGIITTSEKYFKSIVQYNGVRPDYVNFWLSNWLEIVFNKI